MGFHQGNAGGRPHGCCLPVDPIICDGALCRLLEVSARLGAIGRLVEPDTAADVDPRFLVEWASRLALSAAVHLAVLREWAA